LPTFELDSAAGIAEQAHRTRAIGLA